MVQRKSRLIGFGCIWISSIPKGSYGLTSFIPLSTERSLSPMRRAIICRPTALFATSLGEATATGGLLFDRAGALEEAAGYIQRLYWAQFADDTYTGSGTSQHVRLDQLKGKKEDNAVAQTPSDPELPPKPRAPIESLLPATEVRARIDSLSDAIKQMKNDNVGASEVLNNIAQILSTPELASTSTTRKAFNTYTAALQFNANAFSINLPKGSLLRRRYIRENDSLLTVQATITSDLDLRDLHRNQILSLLQDIKAEVAYQKKLCNLVVSASSSSSADEETCDLAELRTMIQVLKRECDVWFSFIPEMDVQRAYQLFLHPSS